MRSTGNFTSIVFRQLMTIWYIPQPSNFPLIIKIISMATCILIVLQIKKNYNYFDGKILNKRFEIIG